MRSTAVLRPSSILLARIILDLLQVDCNGVVGERVEEIEFSYLRSHYGC